MDNKWTITNFEVYDDELKSSIIEVLAKYIADNLHDNPGYNFSILGWDIKMENIPTDIVYGIYDNKKLVGKIYLKRKHN